MKGEKKQIDWDITVIPLILVFVLSVLFMVFPEESNNILLNIRHFFGDVLGGYYIIIGIIFFVGSLFLAFSKYGKIVLGEEKPKYSFFSWGCMMFTCGLAADILFYSFSEWIMYASNPHIRELGSIQEWAGVFPIFHWSFIPWSFYLVLAVAFGFMIHVKKRNRQKFSEACRPILGEKVDGPFGRIIDLFAVFSLIAGTATTFSIATPLMAKIVNTLFHLNVSDRMITIVILIITCIIYTYSLLHGFKGMNILAKLCIYLFFLLLFIVLVFSGNAQYILETGIESFGRMIQNFISLTTYMDPLRTNRFPQDWTIYYWAYWMVWCIAAPFFIGNISEGRTVKQVIMGGYIFGVGSTVVSFLVLGNYSMGLQMTGQANFISEYVSSGNMYDIIVDIISTLPCQNFIFVMLLVTMVAFYATSFDSIAYTACCYSYKSISERQKPRRSLQLIWCILLIVFPIALVFSESSMMHLQSVSIIAAFPIGIIMIFIFISFIKDAQKHAIK